MPYGPNHRKRVRHFEDPGDCRELTFSCYDRRPLLVEDDWRALLSESINRACDGHGFRLAAFVFMPEHLHLLVYPVPGASKIGGFLNAVKRPFSYRVKQLLLESNRGLLDQLTIHQRPGVTTFRYWQEGPGYDRNIATGDAVLTAINYIHMNPVRRELCAMPIDWRWSSARHFLHPQDPVDPLLPTIHKIPRHFFDK